MKCAKIKYPGKYEAELVLEKIKSDANYSKKEKKEARSYYCINCEAWHLTSISQSDAAKRAREKQINSEKHIKKLATYWERKLGIKKDDF